MQNRVITILGVAALLGMATAANAQTIRYAGMPAKAVYTTADTVASTMTGGPMGSMVTTLGSTSVIELELHPVGDSTHVVSRITDMKGTMEAMGQSMDLPFPPEVKEPSEFMLSRSGRTRHIKGVGGVDVARGSTATDAIARMFLHLPERAVKIGDTWTDTTTQAMDSAGIKMNMTGVTRTTYASDSTVGGVKMMVLRVAGDMAMKMSGNVNGMEMTQDLKGTSTMTALFDTAKNLIVYVHDQTKMAGKLDAPAAGMTGVDVSQDVRRTLRMK